MPEHRFVRGWILLVSAGILGLVVGCGAGSRARATVKGKVSIDGTALTVGTVTFYGSNDAIGTAVIDKEGNYVMNDAPLGDVKITVSVPKLPPGGMESMMGKSGMKGLKSGTSVDPESGKTISIMGAMPSKVVSIPQKYSDVDSSGLTFTVQKGEQIKDLPLTPTP